MKFTRPLLKQWRLGLTLLVSLLATAVLAQNPSTKPTGPYLGQTPPGKTPVVFAPGIVSTGTHEFSFSMNPEGTEVYFARGIGEMNIKKIMVTRLVNGVWTDPAPLFPDFADEHFEPSVTPDGRHLYFMAFHPVEGQPRPDIDMFRADRTDNGWGTPYHLEAPFNPMGSMFTSVTRDGVLYTTDTKTGGNDIARTRPTETGFGPYEILGAPINTAAAEVYPFIAPDESFLIFCKMAQTGGGLMVSFRTSDGNWTEPQPIPIGMNGGVPFVSRDGKYLFFTAGKMPSDIYWVDFQIVRDLKPAGTK
jgi:hypothetical protein